MAAFCAQSHTQNRAVVANGRLVLRGKRLDAAILACFVPLFAVAVRPRAFFQEESSFVFRDAHGHCASPQSPCEAIPRDGRSCRFVGCPELCG